VDMADLRARSIALTDRFIAEVEARCSGLTLISPRNSQNRGSQVSFKFDEAFALKQALIAHGVIGDFRAPDVIRFGVTPLYLDEADILAAVDIMENVITNRLWDQPTFKIREKVT